MKVLFPDRIVSRHVGGNTTYARSIRDGLIARGIQTGVIPSGGHPVLTMGIETGYALTKRPQTLLHYSADTGPLLPTRGASILTVHGVASRWTSVARNARQESIWRFRVARAIRSTRGLITVSKSAAEDISEVFGVDRSKISVIYHGVDVARFAERTQMSADLNEKLPDEYALYLGNIEPRKNLIDLVGAFQEPSLKALGLPLVVAGRAAWNFEESMRAIENASNVHYLGFVSDSDRIALMQHATVFVFPSLYEGFGLPVLEALAAGTPVVTSLRGSLAEVAGPSRVIEDLSVAGIAETIVDAVQDSGWQSASGSAGPEWASHFRWDHCIDAHIDAYERVLNT